MCLPLSKDDIMELNLHEKLRNIAHFDDQWLCYVLLNLDVKSSQMSMAVAGVSLSRTYQCLQGRQPGAFAHFNSLPGHSRLSQSNIHCHRTPLTALFMHSSRSFSWTITRSARSLMALLPSLACSSCHPANSPATVCCV